MTECNACELSIKIPYNSNSEKRQKLCKPCTKLVETEQPVFVSPLEYSDLELVLAWRSNPKIYRHFRQQDGPLSWEKHVTWFESRDSNRYDFVVHYDGRRVGVISLSSDNEVSIYLGDYSAHGQGIATTALNWLCERFQGRSPLTAEIYEENEASKRLFRRCGFQQKGVNGEWLQYFIKS